MLDSACLEVNPAARASCVEGPVLVPELDDAGWCVGSDGITLFTRLGHLAWLWSSHAISIPAFLKAPCAPLNSNLKGKSTALFTGVQSGRRLPFVEKGMAKYLPDPPNIAGPILTAVLDCISVDWNETAGRLPSRIATEQQTLTHYSYAPIPSVLDRLDKSDSNPVLEAARQMLNRQPHWRGEAVRAAESELAPVKVKEHADRGVTGRCRMMDGNIARWAVHWDGAPLTKQEIS